MEPLWMGPYIVHRDLGKGLYELKNIDGKLVKKKANINRLKLYTRRKESPVPPGSESSTKESNKKSTELSEKQQPPNSSKEDQPKRPPSSPTKNPPHKKRKVCYTHTCSGAPVVQWVRASVFRGSWTPGFFTLSDLLIVLNSLADTRRAVEEEPGFEGQRQSDP